MREMRLHHAKFVASCEKISLTSSLKKPMATPRRTALSPLFHRCFGSDSQHVVSSNCGVGEETIAALLEANDAVAAADPTLATVDDTDILLALHFLRCYPTIDQARTTWHMSPNTYRAHLDAALTRLDTILPEVCRFSL